MGDHDPLPIYNYLVGELASRTLGFVEVMEPSEWFAELGGEYPAGEE